MTARWTNAPGREGWYWMRWRDEERRWLGPIPVRAGWWRVGFALWAWVACPGGYGPHGPNRTTIETAFGGYRFLPLRRPR